MKKRETNQHENTYIWTKSCQNSLMCSSKLVKSKIQNKKLFSVERIDTQIVILCEIEFEF